MKKDISVFGAGIAGVSTAIGLKKLGFEVTIFYKKRAFLSFEGFSQKTKDGLLQMGCKNAASLLGIKSLRNANWGEAQSGVNYEYVISRKIMDEALLKDAKEFGIKLLEVTIIGKQKKKGDKLIFSYKKKLQIFEKTTDFVVDARGRFTPFKDEYINGPKSFSLLQELKVNRDIEPKTSIDSVEDGWIWQAYLGEGKGYIQFTCDEEIANDVKTFSDVQELIKKQSFDDWVLEGSNLVNSLVKRDAYCKIHKEVVSDNYLLVGDSASSIDPLSGNGAFQALSMSSVAPYVINTIFNLSKNSEVAKKFYRKRVEFIFNKFSNVGKDFYKLEKRYPTSFWQKRQNWPNNLEKAKVPRVEKEAILKDSFIYEHEVIITDENPMGVWLYNNFDVVELAKFCLKNKKEEALEYFEKFCSENKILDNNIHTLKNWLLKQKIISPEA
jgi:flavin-dependent dehydrogenase